MGFVIQWLVCLVAFVAGSAVAYGIALLFKSEGPDETVAEPAIQPEPVRPAESAQRAEPESSEIGAKR